MSKPICWSTHHCFLSGASGTNNTRHMAEYQVSSIYSLATGQGAGASLYHPHRPPFFFTEFFLFFSSPFSHFLPPPLKNKIGSIKKNRHSPPVSLPDLSSPSRQSRDRPAMAIRRCAYRGRTPPTHWSTRPSSERRTW